MSGNSEQILNHTLKGISSWKTLPAMFFGKCSIIFSRARAKNRKCSKNYFLFATGKITSLTLLAIFSFVHLY